MKIKLVENWQDAWQWWSVRLAGLLALVGPTWMALPPEVQQMAKEMIPVEWFPYFTPIVLVIAIARVIDQSSAE